jgi:hypothetical protein
MKRLANTISIVLEERRRLRSRAPFCIAVAGRFSQLHADALGVGHSRGDEPPDVETFK